MRGRDFIGEEKRIGSQYAKELRNSFKSQISVLDKVSGKSSKPGYRVRFRDLMLQSIAVRTMNYPFVNFYGVDGTRRSHQYKSKSGQVFTRKEHPFKLQPKIKDLSVPENILNGLADAISGLRGDRVLAEVAEQFQIKDNFQLN